jgi:hypothetical protein
MDDDFGVGAGFGEMPRPSSVIEMDVRRQNICDVLGTDLQLIEGLQGLLCRVRKARLDDRDFGALRR